MSIKRYFRYGIVASGSAVMLIIYLLSTNISRISKASAYKKQFEPSVDYNVASQAANNTPLIIIRWTSLYRDKFWMGNGTETCYSKDKSELYTCHFTNNRRLLHRAEGILFFLRNTNFHKLPSVRESWQKWILFNKESPIYSSISGPPSRFNLTITYHRESSLICPYGYCKPIGSADPPVSRGVPYLAQYGKANHQGNRSASILKPLNMTQFKRRKHVAWFVSHCSSQSHREKYARNLKKYIQVDIYGKCGSFKCGHYHHRDINCYIDVLDKEYMFYLSFENSLCEDYITEKIFNILALQLNIIPIVLGGSRYEDFLPPQSYINVRDFESPEDLALYLKRLIQNETMYSQYFEWRKDFQCFSIKSANNFECELCRYLHENRHGKDIFPDVVNFWSKVRKCQRPNNFYKGIT